MNKKIKVLAMALLLTLVSVFSYKGNAMASDSEKININKDELGKTAAIGAKVGLGNKILYLSETDLTLEIGETFDVDVKNAISRSKYVYTSSDTSVATVTKKNGIIKAVGTGKTDIKCTITTPDNKKIELTCSVEVK